MSDVDALRARLVAAREAARTAAEACAAVADVEWFNDHSATAPEHPTPAALAAWLPECPADARAEFGALLGDVALLHDDAMLAVAPMMAEPDPPSKLTALEMPHRLWLAHPDRPDHPRPRHPLAPLVAAWQRRAPDLTGATVTVTGNQTDMTRRTKDVSTVRRTPWVLAAEVAGAVVDGEPMAAPLPDPSDLFPMRTRRPRRVFKPNEQRTLAIPPVLPIPTDPRLLALQDVSGDPASSPALPGDVLALLTFAHLADRPLILTEREGAALLVRDRDGKPRHVQRQHDVPRFWEAAAWLRSLMLFDPGGSGRWVDLATVEVPGIQPVDRVTIGPPAWMRAGNVIEWKLTAEGSAASAARVTAGKQGLAGRVVTGIEHWLTLGFSGRRGTVAPKLRPANARSKGGPGAPVFIGWRDALRLAGDWWDEADPAADNAARSRYERTIATLERRCYFVGENLRREAPAGDSVEVVWRVRGARNRPAGLMVRASARFVEAARLAQLPRGAGFERMLLTDYAGLGALPADR